MNKIIHRDLKTENILVHNGVYKICDFGLAKVMDKLTSNSKMTILGTRCTMAPEVLEGKEYGIQADMWSFGVVFYEILTAELPYKVVITEKEINKSI